MADKYQLLNLGLALTLGIGGLQAQPLEYETRVEEPAPAPPVLKAPKTLDGMNLDFSRRVKVSEVLAALGKQSGVTILLHGAVSSEITTSADLRGMNLQQALDALMLQNDLFYKVMDPTTLMVFKNTPQNRADFETRSIRTFQLSYADPDNLRQTLAVLMPGIRVYTDKRLNALTVAGNAGEMAKARQVVQELDKARGEVRLQMEIVDLPRKAATAAGLLPTLLASPGQAAPAEALAALAKAMQEGEGRLLASPDVRVVSGESMAIRIGRKPGPDRVEEAAAPRSASGGRSEDARQAPQGDDLGVKVKVKPTLHPNHEITLDLAYELSDPLKAVGSDRPGVGERVLKTTLSLKDGETVILGGLLEDDLSDRGPEGPRAGKVQRDRLLVVKAVVVRW